MSYALAHRRGRGMGEVTLAQTLVTPGDMSGAGERINTAAVSLNNDVQAHVAPIVATAAGQRFFTDWMAWYPRWVAFYHQLQVVGGDAASTSWGDWLSSQRLSGSYLSTGLAAHLHTQSDQYNALEVRYTALVGAPTVSTHSYVSWGEWFSRLGNAGMLWAGIGIVGIGTVGYLMSQYAKIKTVSHLALNPRRARRRRNRRTR